MRYLLRHTYTEIKDWLNIAVEPYSKINQGATLNMSNLNALCAICGLLLIGTKIFIFCYAKLSHSHFCLDNVNFLNRLLARIKQFSYIFNW